MNFIASLPTIHHKLVDWNECANSNNKNYKTGVTHPRSQVAKRCFATMVCEQECVTSVTKVKTKPARYVFLNLIIMSFPCTKCGLCCKHIDKVKQLSDYHTGDGICIYYDPKIGCQIYPNRPYICKYKHDGIVWIDTPGLDADVYGKDDQKAMAGAFQMADFVLLVHRVDLGELDKNEMELYHDLIQRNSCQKMCLVLTQIDQVNNEQLEQVISSLNRQLALNTKTTKLKPIKN